VSIKHLQLDDTETLLADAVTSSFQTVLSMSDDADLIFINNGTDVSVLVRIPSGYSATKILRITGLTSMTIDCRSNSKRIAKGLIEVSAASNLPSYGEINITVCR